MPGSTEKLRSNLSIEVRTPDPGIRDWLEDLLQSVGAYCHTKPQQSTDVVLWDVDPWVLGIDRKRPDIPSATSGTSSHCSRRFRAC